MWMTITPRNKNKQAGFSYFVLNFFSMRTIKFFSNFIAVATDSHHSHAWMVG
jgi:hypothetical protein